MNKLILFSAALLLASQASAYAQGDQSGRHHKRLMNSNAQLRYEGGNRLRAPEYVPQIVAPSYSNSPSYYNSDPSAEGRTGS